MHRGMFQDGTRFRRNGVYMKMCSNATPAKYWAPYVYGMIPVKNGNTYTIKGNKVE